MRFLVTAPLSEGRQRGVNLKIWRTIEMLGELEK